MAEPGVIAAKIGGKFKTLGSKIGGIAGGMGEGLETIGLKTAEGIEESVASSVTGSLTQRLSKGAGAGIEGAIAGSAAGTVIGGIVGGVNEDESVISGALKGGAIGGLAGGSIGMASGMLHNNAGLYANMKRDYLHIAKKFSRSGAGDASGNLNNNIDIANAKAVSNQHPDLTGAVYQNEGRY